MCLSCPPCRWWWGRHEWHVGEWGQSWDWVNSYPPFCLRFLKLEDLHSASRGKRGRREGNRCTSVGQSEGTLSSSPRLPCGVTEGREVSFASTWKGLWRPAKERTIILKGCLSKWSDRDQKGQGEPEISLCKSQSGDRVLQKDTVDACQRELQASSMHATTKSLLQTYVRPASLGKWAFSLLTTTSSLESGTEMKLLKWKKLNILHTQPQDCKVYTCWTNNYWALTMCQKVGTRSFYIYYPI